MTQIIEDIYNGVLFTLIVGGRSQLAALYLTIIAYTKTVHRDIGRLFKAVMAKFEVDYAF